MALNKNQKLGYIAYISSSVIWGFSFMFTKRALEHLDGRLFVDYLSSLKRDRIRRKLEKDARSATVR